MNKYHNIKTEIDGITFDSRKEANRYAELKLLLRAHQISDLKLQQTIELLPSFRDPNGKKQQAIKYIADFMYTEGDTIVIEDTKGFKTKEYIIKKKLLLFAINRDTLAGNSKYKFIES